MMAFITISFAVGIFIGLLGAEVIEKMGNKEMEK